MFGTLDVLAPLRLDELGASAAVIGATFLVAGGARGGESPYIGRLSDRHGRVLPAFVGLAAAGRGDRAAAVAGGDVGCWSPSCSSRRPASGSCGRRRWRCSPTAPRPAAIDQGYAVALTNLAWSTGQTLGLGGRRAAGGGLRRRAALPAAGRPVRADARRADPAALLGGAGWEVKAACPRSHSQDRAQAARRRAHGSCCSARSCSRSGSSSSCWSTAARPRAIGVAFMSLARSRRSPGSPSTGSALISRRSRKGKPFA